jgi:proton-coupled amino acid transporter
MFSEKHFGPHSKCNRTSSPFMTAINLIKVCLGISFVSVSKSISQAGIYGALIGAVYVVVVNVFGMYLIIKARNRFKRDDNIIDVCDLGVKLYGNWLRPILTIILVLCNFSFLMAYTMFFGSQTDLIVCKTFKGRECGHRNEYSIIISACLLPIIYIRELSNIGYFSMVILIFTLIAILIIIYISIDIITLSPQET